MRLHCPPAGVDSPYGSGQGSHFRPSGGSWKAQPPAWRTSQDFVNFQLHETSEVDLVVDGERRTDRLFGSVVQVGGQWKVLSYPDDR